MKKDNLIQLFENLKDDFDMEVPNIGHQERFLAKLNSKDTTVVLHNRKAFKPWKPLLAVAAMIILCFSLFTILYQQPDSKDLASVSPELSKTQDFFTSTIETELINLKKERTPATKMLIDDAMNQLKILETDYESLRRNLTESGDDKRVIYAMISNFQNRIDVLQNVMKNIEEVKQLKQLTL